MFAVIRENRDRSITRLLTCGSLEAVERTTIRAVAMDDGGYTEILL